MSLSTLNLVIENQIGVLTITRPEALNALNSQVLQELEQTLVELKGLFPSKLRGLILTGAGEKSFVAGADIAEMAALTPSEGLAFGQRGQRILRMFETLPFPVIAAVNGFALGGGLELALSCDFIYASENAKLGLPEVNLGLIPGFGGTVRLARVVGVNRARELIFSAQMLTAADALAMGLVNKVVPRVDLLATARTTMDAILAKGPLAVSAAKRSILEGHDLAMDQALKNEADHFGALFGLNDTREGTKAFIEKRKAIFKAE